MSETEYEIEIPGVGMLRVEQDWVDVSQAVLGPRRVMVAGRTAYYLNGRPITEDEAQRLRDV